MFPKKIMLTLQQLFPFVDAHMVWTSNMGAGVGVGWRSNPLVYCLVTALAKRQLHMRVMCNVKNRYVIVSVSNTLDGFTNMRRLHFII